VQATGGGENRDSSAVSTDEGTSDTAAQIAIAAEQQPYASDPIDNSAEPAAEQATPQVGELPEAAQNNPKTAEPGKRAERAPPFGGIRSSETHAGGAAKHAAGSNGSLHASDKAALAPGQVKATLRARSTRVSTHCTE
jgi:hypothetical protein